MSRTLARAAVLLGIVALGMGGATHQLIPAQRAAASDPIALGVYLHDTPNNISYKPSDPGAMDRYAQMVGRMPAIFMWFQIWGKGDDSFPTAYANQVYTRGAIPMITWQPGTDQKVADTPHRPAAVATGNSDTYIRQWAEQAKAFGRPFFLRFAHEMNGNWYPWGTGPANPNNNSAPDYVAEWRHVHDIFTQVGATNAIWVWCAATASSHASDPAEDYPGDNYVDWIAMDGYNRGVTQSGNNNWTNAQTIFGSTYQRLTQLTNKPMMIAETAAASVGGDKPAWITQTFLQDLPTLFPRLRAVIWFNSLKERDWRVDSSPESLTAWQQVVASPLYQGTASQLLSESGASSPTSTPVPAPTNTPAPAPTQVPTVPVPSSRALSILSVVQTVAPGRRQTIKVQTPADRQVVRFRVNYPNGDHQSAKVTSNADGLATYAFVQGPSKIAHGDRTAVIRVQIAGHTVLRRYQIGFARIDVMVEPRHVRIGDVVSVYVHARVHDRVGIELRSHKTPRVVGRQAWTWQNGWRRFDLRIGNRLRGNGATKVSVVATLLNRPSHRTTSTFFTIR